MLHTRNTQQVPVNLGVVGLDVADVRRDEHGEIGLVLLPDAVYTIRYGDDKVRITETEDCSTDTAPRVRVVYGTSAIVSIATPGALGWNGQVGCLAFDPASGALNGILRSIYARQLPTRQSVGGTPTAVGAGATVWLTPVVPLDGWEDLWIWVANDGANPMVATQIGFYRDAAGTIGNVVQTNFAIAAGLAYWQNRGGGANEWIYNPRALGAAAVRLAVVGGPNPTTARGWINVGRS